MRFERWVFTDRELDNPLGCHANDEFVADIDECEDGVIVYRNGDVSNRFADGTCGVPVELVALAEQCETLYRGEDYADNWRSVVVDNDGYFVRFCDPYELWTANESVGRPRFYLPDGKVYHYLNEQDAHEFVGYRAGAFRSAGDSRPVTMREIYE